MAAVTTGRVPRYAPRHERPLIPRETCCARRLAGICLRRGGGVHEAHATRNQQGTRPAHARPTEWGGAYVVDGRDNAWRSRAPGPHPRGNTVRQVMDGLRTEVRGQRKQSIDPGNNQHNPRYANCWAPLTCKRHIPPQPAQPQHTNHWAPRTREQHRQEHRPQRPTESSDPTQHAKGRWGDCPGLPEETTTRRHVTQGGYGGNSGAASERMQGIVEAVVGGWQCGWGWCGGRGTPLGSS